ncbi:hypothetical protein Cgig2_020768 [Carnegiea gigantea]|uniref:Uncharacterized protein n=1 Tax=Carnegiea gigantea TaxID=171969 RepID=A0A9Q1K1M0_9CARY|nr:hypothetical protein Cgig2_020768 [Carnegiea gigantea]
MEHSILSTPKKAHFSLCPHSLSLWQMSWVHYPFQKTDLMGCAVPPLINTRPSHRFSNVGLLSVTLLVTDPLNFPQKTSLMECAAPLLINPGSSYHFSDVGLLSVTFSPTQSCDALVKDGTPCLPHPSERLTKYQSRVWVGSDTTCHGAITLSQKDRSFGERILRIRLHRTILG